MADDVVLWTFPKEELARIDDPQPYDDAVFEIRPRNFRDAYFSRYMAQKEGGTFEDDWANEVLNHIVSIESKGKKMTKTADLDRFISNMEEERGFLLVGAIRRRMGLLSKGLVKNS